MIKAALNWLPEAADFPKRLAALKAGSGSFFDWVALARSNLNFLRTENLAQAFAASFPAPPAQGLAAPPIKLALLSSCTTQHLHAGIRVAALRRGLWVEIYEPDYGQYFAELADAGSGLHRFAPDAVLFAFDARHMTRGLAPAQGADAAQASIGQSLAHVQACWELARAAGAATLLQQTILPAFPALLGENEHLLPGSPAAAVQIINTRLREIAATNKVSLLAVDQHAARHGLAAWHSAPFWHQAKQDILPSAAPYYGDLVARLLAAGAGRAAKCAVLDLDNTLWGGVIGDDGLEGIVLGQGSAEGEAFLAFQAYLKDLAARGVILAVCSKNDEANALAVFEHHPEMLLRRKDIACFVANWQDKAANICHIAKELNIGLDAIVFIDDNPFERNLVRGALPMVAVPEVPEEPASVAQCIADAGYFEALMVTQEDFARGAQYQANAARGALAASTTDVDAYLRSLDMVLLWADFDATSLSRVTQLINKSNQFNLTTKRYQESDVRAVIEDEAAAGLHFRLTDRFGDNGIIAVIILRFDGDAALIDTWLMSCRVLGRQVERACLAVLAEIASARGAARLIGRYVPSDKNGMVAGHYKRLGFVPAEASENSLFELALSGYTQPDLPLEVAPAARNEMKRVPAR